MKELIVVGQLTFVWRASFTAYEVEKLHRDTAEVLSIVKVINLIEAHSQWFSKFATPSMP